MKIIEPGHIYDLNWLDMKKEGEEKIFKTKENPGTLLTSLLVFVNREAGTEHPGTQTQEVLRALIDRTMHCDNCLRWEGNDQIIYHLRMALVLHEARALERKTVKGIIAPELIVTGRDGHFHIDSHERYGR